MKTLEINRHRGWSARLRTRRKLGTFEDQELEDESSCIDDWGPDWGGACEDFCHLSLIVSEHLYEPFDRGLPLGLDCHELEECPRENVNLARSKGAAWTEWIRMEKALRSCFYCDELMDGHKKVAAELREAGVTGERFLGPYSSSEFELLNLILCSRPFWVRTPRSWRPPSGVRFELLLHLAEHLLAVYQVPAWLQPVHVLQGKRSVGGHDCHTCPDLPWALYVASTQGWKLGPVLRESALRHSINLPFSAARFAFDVPKNATASEAFRWLSVRANGGSVAVADCLAGLMRPLNVTWLPSLVRFLEAAPELLSEADCILDWVIHQETEAARARATPFTMTGRSPARVREAAVQYRESLNRRHGDRKWSPHGWNLELLEGNHSWSVKELENSLQLFEEGQSMHHCVAGYDSACERGSCAIFTVRMEGRRMLTVEVNPATRQVVQVRGFANRIPTPSESLIIQKWAKRFELTY